MGQWDESPALRTEKHNGSTIHGAAVHYLTNWNLVNCFCLYSNATLRMGKLVPSNAETAFIKAQGLQLPKSI